MPEDLAGAALVLLEDWRVLSLLVLGPSTTLGSLLEDPLVGYHHHHGAVIGEDAAAIWAIFAEVAQPELLFMHLHHLHDGSLHLDLVASAEGGALALLLVGDPQRLLQIDGANLHLLLVLEG